MCTSCNLQHQHHVKNEIHVHVTQNKFSLVYCVPRLHYCYKYYSTHTQVPVPPHTQVHRKGTRKSFPRHLPLRPLDRAQHIFGFSHGHVFLAFAITMSQLILDTNGYTLKTVAVRGHAIRSGVGNANRFAFRVDFDDQWVI